MDRRADDRVVPQNHQACPAGSHGRRRLDLQHVGHRPGRRRERKLLEEQPDLTGARLQRDDVTELSPAYAYWLAKAELRFSLWKFIGAAAFADVGSGWSFEAERRGWSALEQRATMASVGFGPRLNWVLPIRLDFVRQLTKPLASADDASGLTRVSPGWKVEFGIGHAF